MARLRRTVRRHRRTRLLSAGVGHLPAGSSPSRFRPSRFRIRRRASGVSPRDPETVPPRQCPDYLPWRSPVQGTIQPPAGSLNSAIEDFLDWHTEHADNSPDARDEAAEALELLLAEWGPDVPPDERAFYACSPHRIQACASILRDSYESDWVDKALSLLPDWTQWCASKTALDAEAVGRALTAARAEAAILASETHTVTEDEAPFRRPE